MIRIKSVLYSRMDHKCQFRLSSILSLQLGAYVLGSCLFCPPSANLYNKGSVGGETPAGS
jgi:hypothetical protein